MEIKITKTKDRGYTVEVGGQFADWLAKDEALGIVASALFGSEEGPHPYTKTYELWARRDSKHREMCGLPPVVISGLLGATA